MLTREDCRHESREHEEQHTEEEETRVIVRLGAVVPDIQVQQTDHNTNG